MENKIMSNGEQVTATLETAAKSNGHCVVGIGASAGGLEAIHEFFDNVPDNTNVSFIVVQHLSSDYKSLLVELVSKHTHMNAITRKIVEKHNGLIRAHSVEQEGSSFVIVAPIRQDEDGTTKAR